MNSPSSRATVTRAAALKPSTPARATAPSVTPTRGRAGGVAAPSSVPKALSTTALSPSPTPNNSAAAVLLPPNDAWQSNLEKLLSHETFLRSRLLYSEVVSMRRIFNVAFEEGLQCHGTCSGEERVLYPTPRLPLSVRTMMGQQNTNAVGSPQQLEDSATTCHPFGLGKSAAFPSPLFSPTLSEWKLDDKAEEGGSGEVAKHLENAPSSQSPGSPHHMDLSPSHLSPPSLPLHFPTTTSTGGVSPSSMRPPLSARGVPTRCRRNDVTDSRERSLAGGGSQSRRSSSTAESPFPSAVPVRGTPAPFTRVVPPLVGLCTPRGPPTAAQEEAARQLLLSARGERRLPLPLWHPAPSTGAGGPPDDAMGGRHGSETSWNSADPPLEASRLSAVESPRLLSSDVVTPRGGAANGLPSSRYRMLHHPPPLNTGRNASGLPGMHNLANQIPTLSIPQSQLYASPFTEGEIQRLYREAEENWSCTPPIRTRKDADHRAQEAVQVQDFEGGVEAATHIDEKKKGVFAGTTERKNGLLHHASSMNDPTANTNKKCVQRMRKNAAEEPSLLRNVNPALHNQLGEGKKFSPPPPADNRGKTQPQLEKEGHGKANSRIAAAAAGNHSLHEKASAGECERGDGTGEGDTLADKVLEVTIEMVEMPDGSKKKIIRKKVLRRKPKPAVSVASPAPITVEAPPHSHPHLQLSERTTTAVVHEGGDEVHPQKEHTKEEEGLNAGKSILANTAEETREKQPLQTENDSISMETTLKADEEESNASAYLTSDFPHHQHPEKVTAIHSSCVREAKEEAAAVVAGTPRGWQTASTPRRDASVHSSSAAAVGVLSAKAEAILAASRSRAASLAAFSNSSAAPEQKPTQLEKERVDTTTATTGFPFPGASAPRTPPPLAPPRTGGVAGAALALRASALRSASSSSSRHHRKNSSGERHRSSSAVSSREKCAPLEDLHPRCPPPKQRHTDDDDDTPPPSRGPVEAIPQLSLKRMEGRHAATLGMPVAVCYGGNPDLDISDIEAADDDEEERADARKPVPTPRHDGALHPHPHEEKRSAEAEDALLRSSSFPVAAVRVENPTGPLQRRTASAHPELPLVPTAGVLCGGERSPHTASPLPQRRSRRRTASREGGLVQETNFVATPASILSLLHPEAQKNTFGQQQKEEDEHEAVVGQRSKGFTAEPREIAMDSTPANSVTAARNGTQDEEARQRNRKSENAGEDVAGSGVEDPPRRPSPRNASTGIRESPVMRKHSDEGREQQPLARAPLLVPVTKEETNVVVSPTTTKSFSGPGSATPSGDSSSATACWTSVRDPPRVSPSEKPPNFKAELHDGEHPQQPRVGSPQCRAAERAPRKDSLERALDSTNALQRLRCFALPVVSPARVLCYSMGLFTLMVGGAALLACRQTFFPWSTVFRHAFGWDE